MKLGIEKSLDGLMRGAEKFGTKVAEKLVKKMAKRVNGFSPEEPEPYGLGMGGANTEQQSDKATLFQPAKENALGSCPECGGKVQSAGGRQMKGEDLYECNKCKLSFKPSELKNEDSSKAKENSDKPYCLVQGCSQDAISSFKGPNSPLHFCKDHSDKARGMTPKERADFTTWPNGIKNEDSSNLGYQSAQKTTTAERSEYENIGTGAGDYWDSINIEARKRLLKKVDADVKYATDSWRNLMVPIRDAIKQYGDLKNNKTVPFISTSKAQQKIDDLRKMLEKESAPDAKAAIEFEIASLEKMVSAPDADSEQERVSKCMACGYESPRPWTGICESCLTKNETGVEGKAPARDVNMEVPLENATDTDCKMCHGPLNEDDETCHNADCPAGEKPYRNSNPIRKEDVVMSNAGHLSPDAWDMASFDERSIWLEKARQDVALADRRWAQLSLDTHAELMEAFDFERVNSSDEDTLLCKCGHADEKHMPGGECETCSCNKYRKNSAGHPDSEENLAENAGLKKFKFVDAHGEAHEVEAADESAAWTKLSKDFATSVEDIKGMGIKLKNDDEKGDVEEIERHVEGIEHEVSELKETSLVNSKLTGVQRGATKYGSGAK